MDYFWTIRLPNDPLATPDALALKAAMEEEMGVKLSIGKVFVLALRESLKARKIPRAKRVPVPETTKETL